MNHIEKQQIHHLFEHHNYRELYRTYPKTLNEMLMLKDEKEFEEFLEGECEIEENIFFLYHSAACEESLLIGGYEGEATQQIHTFLKTKLPEPVWNQLKGHLQNLHIDIDGEDNLKEVITEYNQQIEHTGYHIKIEYEDTYCAGVYFLSVVQQK